MPRAVRNFRRVVIVVGSSTLAACSTTPAGGGDATVESTVTAPVESRSVAIDSITLSSGLVIEDVQAGAGDMCLPDSWVRVRYTCRLTDGMQVDSSGDETLVLHIPRMIRGWQDGMPGMRVGGRRRLTVPAALGYGSRPVKDSRGVVVIPADSMLIYEIDLLGIVAGPDAAAPQTRHIERTGHED